MKKGKKKRDKLNNKIILIITLTAVVLAVILMSGLFKSPGEPTQQELLDMLKQGELRTSTSYTSSGEIWCDGADVDRDGEVDMSDLDILTENWLRNDCSEDNTWCNRADVDEDGDVDASDYAIVTGELGEEGCADGFCKDGTKVGECSSLNSPLYCDGSGDYIGGSDDTISEGSEDYTGDLVFDLSKCGADAGKCCESSKYVARFATYLAVNIPSSASCSSAYTYFDEETIGGWLNPSFSEKSGMAQVGGGYPTRITCSGSSFVVSSGSGVRHKSGSCIFVSLSNPQQQVAILDWSSKSYAYCNHDGDSVEAVKVELV